MKKAILLTMVLVVCAVLMCFSSTTFALTDGDWEFKLLDNKIKITDYIGEGGDVVIPETIYDCPVVEIEANVFNSENVKSLTFPTGIKEIPTWMSDNDSLETIIFSEGTEIIHQYAFDRCRNLKNVKLPETLKKIGGAAFEGTAITSIEIPASVMTIGGQAFRGTNLISVDLSKSNISFGDGVFMNCKNLKTVKFHPELTQIKPYTFEGCEALETIEIPSSVSYIGFDAFQDCVNLKNVILPVNLKKIGGAAFANCDKLVEVVVPYGVETIGDGASGAFAYCDSLKSLFFPDTVTEIGGGDYSWPDNCIIYCSKNSFTEKYCKDWEISYLTDNSVNSGITVLYNGTRISFHSYGQNPELIESRTLVPLRSIFEAMGAEVEWNGATNTAVAVRDGVKIEVQIGASEIYKNGSSIPVDVPARLINDRTMVPARVIAEAFGADVQWNDSGRTVLISE